MMKTNRIDKIQASQQLLSASSVITYASMSLARFEVIHDFHKSRKLGFHFVAQPLTEACGLGIRTYVKVRKKRATAIVERTSVLASKSIRIGFCTITSKGTASKPDSKGINPLWSCPDIVSPP